MFDILRKENCFYVAPDDLKSMMAGILLSHPGLEFLQETPEFQDRYTAAVVFSMLMWLSEKLGCLILPRTSA